MGPIFDGGLPEPGAPIQVEFGREYMLVRTRAFFAAVIAAVVLPFAALVAAVLLDTSAAGGAAMVGAGSVPLVALLTAGNKHYFGSSGVVLRARGVERRQGEDDA